MRPPLIIKSAAEAGMKVLGTTVNHIIMVTLWVLFVKCRAQGITKEAILCKYSRQRNCLSQRTYMWAFAVAL